MIFDWDHTENRKLQAERGISFERILLAIEEGGLLGVLEHPNRERYADQLLLIVAIDYYAWAVPARKQSDRFFEGS